MYHIGLEVLYVLGLLVRKERFYIKPNFITLLLNNQDILLFNSVSVMIMALWKMHLEVRTLLLVCMIMTHKLMMMKWLLLRVASTRRDIKDLQISLR